MDNVTAYKFVGKVDEVFYFRPVVLTPTGESGTRFNGIEDVLEHLYTNEEGIEFSSVGLLRDHSVKWYVNNHETKLLRGREALPPLARLMSGESLNDEPSGLSYAEALLREYQ